MRRKVAYIKWLMSGIVLSVFLSLILFLPVETRADSVYWIGGPGGAGNWNWAANWDPGIPVTGEFAFIGDDRTGANWSAEVYYTTTPTYASGDPYVPASLSLTARGTNTVELYHSAGTLTIDGTFNSLVITAFDGGAAAYYLSDNGVLIEKGYEVKVATGFDSTGVFVQTGGTFQLNAGLYVGDGEYGSLDSNSSGQYFMEGGTIEGWDDGTTTHYGSITVGEWGGASGEFYQTGGSVTINDLNLARQAASYGYYELWDGGTLTVLNEETIGGAGTGIFNQYGGSHTVQGREWIGSSGTGIYNQEDGIHTVMGNLYLGDQATGHGTYNLNWGTLDVSAYDAGDEYLAGYTVIGHNGTGVFNQYDGSTFNARVLVLGGGPYAGIDPAKSTGTYNMFGGTLTAHLIEVGRDDGKGIFNQTAGSVTTNNLYMGSYTGGDGEYTISNDAVLEVNGNMEIGSVCKDGNALFTQKDASSVTVTDTIYLGSLDSTYTNGTYEMQGGTLTARGIEVGQGGRFTQQDGSVTVTDGIYVGNPYSTSGLTGIYDMQGGTLTAGWIDVVQGNQFIYSGGSVAAGIENHGVISGTGTFEGDVTNYGTIEPGSSPGTLTINGTLFMDSTGILHMELGGTNPGEYDLIQVNGEAQLAGILNVDLWNGFTPMIGDYFDILTASIIFGNLSLGNTPSGWSWELAYLDLNGDTNLDTVRLTANAVPIPGAIWLFAPALIGLAGLRRRLTR